MNINEMLSASIGNDIRVLTRTKNRLNEYGWTKNDYVTPEGSCCLIGAIDEWSYEHEYIDPTCTSPTSYADPNNTVSVKIAVANLIFDRHYEIYIDFKNEVEHGYTIGSLEFLEDVYWAEATIMHFNDHPLVQFEDVITLINEVLDEYDA